MNYDPFGIVGPWQNIWQYKHGVAEIMAEILVAPDQEGGIGKSGEGGASINSLNKLRSLKMIFCQLIYFPRFLQPLDIHSITTTT